MTRLTLLVAFLAACYGGYWFYGASAVEKSATEAIAELNNDGWHIDYADLNTAGFPNRFDTSLTDFTVREPTTGITWSAPIVEALALSYIPDRAIVAFAPSQTVTLPTGEVLTVASEGLRASLDYGLVGGFALNAMTAEVGQVTVLSDRGWRASSSRSLVAQRRVADDPTSHDLWFETQGLALSPDLHRLADPAAALPDALSLVRADSRVTLDPATGQIEALVLRDWRLTWGDIVIEITGDLRADERGFAQGSASVSAQGWHSLIGVLVSLGLLPEGTAPTAVNMLDAMAQGAGTVDVPITFANGAASVGFIPIGPAPKLR